MSLLGSVVGGLVPGAPKPGASSLATSGSSAGPITVDFGAGGVPSSPLASGSFPTFPVLLVLAVVVAAVVFLQKR